MRPVIVVVDNAEDIRAMFTALAQYEDWILYTYTYAEISLARIQQLNPDLLVLDLVYHRLPEGWDLLQLLKMEESTAAIPLIISTTLMTLPLEIHGYLASRDIIVISKPFGIEEFMMIARPVLMLQSDLLDVMIRKKPILLVEDNAAISSDFLFMLQMEGYLATTVPNGQLALDAVQSGRYSLIFTDIQMPLMNGLEFIAAYALIPGSHTPVVIFSAETDLDLVNMPAFVIGRLPKPFVLEELLLFARQYAQPVV